LESPRTKCSPSVIALKTCWVVAGKCIEGPDATVKCGFRSRGDIAEGEAFKETAAKVKEEGVNRVWPKFNPQLFERLKNKLGVKNARLYQMIETKAYQTALDRHIAALLVAADNGINYSKYSTPEERAQIRSVVSSISSRNNPAANVDQKPPSSNRRSPGVKGIRHSKPKDNTVFIVYGRNEKLR
jgi:hypothetical protein